VKIILTFSIIILSCIYSISYSKLIAQQNKENITSSQCKYSDIETQNIAERFAQSLYEYLKKENKLDEVILLSNLRSENIDEDSLDIMRSIFINEFRKHKMKIIDKKQKLETNTNDGLASYRLSFTFKCDSQNKYSYAEMESMKTFLLLWMDMAETKAK
jgi:GTP-binding protein EngB required for normal cell division